MKKKRRDYSEIKPDCFNGHVEPERIIIKSSIEIDHSIFQKSEHEKKILKWLKSQAKQVNNK